MSRSTTTSLTRLLGVGALVLALSSPALAAPPASNPGQPFAEILAQLGILNDKLDDLLANGVDLRGVTQNWDKKLSGAERFTVLTDFNDKAVRDNETGLVWEKSPDPDPQANWQSALSHCASLEVDDRKGWALPLREQLASLVDETGTGVDSSGDPLTLPDGHPFDPAGVQSASYWSATSNAGNPSNVWFVGFTSGSVLDIGKVGVLNLRAWCVRGNQSFDGNTHTTLH